MYTVVDVNKLQHIWHFCCVKYNNQYRYYGIVYNTEYDYVLISLMDNEFKVIDHYRYPKNHADLSQIFLNACKTYDTQVFPEIFAHTSA